MAPRPDKVLVDKRFKLMIEEKLLESALEAAAKLKYCKIKFKLEKKSREVIFLSYNKFFL